MKRLSIYQMHESLTKAIKALNEEFNDRPIWPKGVSIAQEQLGQCALELQAQCEHLDEQLKVTEWRKSN